MSHVLVLSLPRSRRGREALYQYRLLHRVADLAAEGCLMQWLVVGGSQPYTVALERTPDGRLSWSCDCADAIYRGDSEPDHACRHVKALRPYVGVR